MSRSTRVLLGIITSGAAALLLARMLSWSDLQRARENLSDLGGWALLALVPWAFIVWIDSLALAQIFAWFGRTVGRWRIAGARLTAEAFGSVLAGGGLVADGVTPMLLEARAQIPVWEGAAAVAARKYFMILAQGGYLAIAGVLLVVEGYGRTPRGGGLVAAGWLVFLSAMAALVGAAVLTHHLGSGTASTRLSAWLSRLPVPALRRRIARARDDLQLMDAQLARVLNGHPRFFASVLGLYFVTWIVEVVETWLILRLLGVPIAFVHVLAFEPAVSLLRNLAFFLPAGLGVQDAGYIVMFRAFGVADPDANGAAFTVIKRLKELVYVACGGVLMAASGARLGEVEGTSS